jgi:hypothetical protein
MINEQLLQYIKSQRNAGTSDEKIKENLSAAGWRDEDIAEGFEAVSTADKTSPENHQDVRQEATEDRQKQKSEDANQGNDATKSTDQYRETVTKGGRQPQNNNQKGTETNSGRQTGQKKSHHDTQQDQASQQSNRHTANEDPQALRTMEEDRQRVRGSDESQSDEPKKTSSQSDQKTGKEKASENTSQTDQRTTESKKSSRGETSGYHPTEARQSKKGGTDSQKQSESSQNRKSVSPRKRKQAKTQSKRKAGTKSATNKNRKRRQSRIQQAKQQSAASSISAIILSILALVLVGGGAAYAYLNYFQGPSAESTAQSVMESLANSRQFEYRIGVGRPTEDGSANQEMLVIEGAINLNSKDNSYYTITRPSTPSSSVVTGVPSELLAYSEIDQRQQQTIDDLLFQPDYLSVGEFQAEQQLGVSEESSGFSTNRFGITLDSAQLATAYTTAYETLYDEPLADTAATILQERIGGFTPQQGQIWVHPTSRVPYQMTLVGTDSEDEDMLINVQFREHGNEITQPPETYESRPIVSGLAESLGVSGTEESDLAQTTSTDSSQTTSTNQATATESGNDDSEDTQEESVQTNRVRQQDRLRMNDIQQMQVALRSFAQENGNYPANLSELAASQNTVIPSLPVDPNTGNAYSYAVNQEQTVFHVGATLEATSSQQAPNDADYNSTSQGFAGGFNGSDNTCQPTSQLNGSTCYDLRGSISTVGS